MNEDHSQMIEGLYTEMYRNMMAYARAVLGESLAEEAVQETFRIACQKAEALAKSENPRGWLMVTLRNTINNTRRSQESARQILTKFLVSQILEVSFLEDKISLDVMYENVADLEEYKLLKEMAIDGKSHVEMSRDRGISVVACKKRVQRAKEVLRNKIGK